MVLSRKPPPHSASQQLKQQQPQHATLHDMVMTDPNGIEIVSGDTSQPLIYRQLVKTRREVLVSKTVKTPVILRQLVPVVRKQRVLVKRQVEEQEMVEVQVPYTIDEDVKKRRQKMAWTQEMRTEEVVESVPVKRTRIVKRPVMRIEQQECYQTVQVPSTKVVLVDSTRTEQVADVKIVETEEWEMYELQVHNTGAVERGAVRELGLLSGHDLREVTHDSIAVLNADDTLNSSSLSTASNNNGSTIHRGQFSASTYSAQPASPMRVSSLSSSLPQPQRQQPRRRIVDENSPTRVRAREAAEAARKQAEVTATAETAAAKQARQLKLLQLQQQQRAQQLAQAQQRQQKQQQPHQQQQAGQQQQPQQQRQQQPSSRLMKAGQTFALDARHTRTADTVLRLGLGWNQGAGFGGAGDDGNDMDVSVAVFDVDGRHLDSVSFARKSGCGGAVRHVMVGLDDDSVHLDDSDVGTRNAATAAAATAAADGDDDEQITVTLAALPSAAHSLGICLTSCFPTDGGGGGGGGGGDDAAAGKSSSAQSPFALLERCYLRLVAVTTTTAGVHTHELCRYNLTPPPLSSSSSTTTTPFTACVVGMLQRHPAAVGDNDDGDNSNTSSGGGWRLHTLGVPGFARLARHCEPFLAALVRQQARTASSSPGGLSAATDGGAGRHAHHQHDGTSSDYVAALTTWQTPPTSS